MNCLNRFVRSVWAPWFYVAAVWANCGFWAYVLLRSAA
jgi:hypothetical protein